MKNPIHDATLPIIEIVASGIHAVLNGARESFEIEMTRRGNPSSIGITPAIVERILEPHGWEKGELQTNGWQYDWWLPFTKDGKSFTASGSGYYGGFRFAATEAP